MCVFEICSAYSPTLRVHGLRPQELYLVARATTVAYLQYASPAWWEFATEEQRNYRAASEEAPKMWAPVDFPTFAALVTEEGLRSFQSISSNPYHVLRHYFRQREPTGYSLRPRSHSFALLAKDDINLIDRKSVV